MMMLIPLEMGVSVQPVKVTTNVFKCRFGCEFYSVSTVGSKKESLRYLQSIADTVKLTDTIEVKPSLIRYLSSKGNKRIGNDTYIADMQFLCYFGTNQKAREERNLETA
jgi:hypothetical protein